MTVRVKQKHLILIPQHHWSPTTSHLPPLHPLLQPPAPPPLPLLLFEIAASGNFQKIGKKRAIICIANTWFWDLKHKLLVHTEANRGFVLDSEQKLRYSELIWFKIIAKWYNMQNTYESDLSESASKPFSKVAILKCKKSKKLAFQTTRKHFFRLSK